jgi:hypothetical protein
VTVEEAQQS